MRDHQMQIRIRRFPRLRAVLAGGLVLGVGATVTLAAWTDQDYASGKFTAGTFSIIGSTDGSSFAEHPSEPGATLSFGVNAGKMSPGTTVFALYSVKTGSDSVAGYVQPKPNASNTSGLGTYLQYGIAMISGTACDASTFAAGTPVSDSSARVALAASGAAQINYCIRVALPANAPNSAQGTSLTARWTFDATTDAAGN